MLVRANVLEFDKQNLNNRIYPLEIKDKILEKYKDSSYLLLGEYPISERTIISLENISHKIKSLEYKEDNGKKLLVGTFELLDTHTGKFVQEILNNGLNLYANIRGVGIITENGIIDKDNYKFITIDINDSTSFADDLCKLEIVTQ